MQLAVDESKHSVHEDASVHPFVGAVIVSESGKVIAKAHRGERGKGDHAEFIAITKASENGMSDLSSCMIFVTLEPCTHRGYNKVPCAERVVQSGLRQVYIGALDPNPMIVGHGETYLRSREGMTVERFPSDIERQIRELNKDFWSLFATSHLPTTSHYIAVRVSDIIHQKLRAAGTELDHMPSDPDYSLRDLASYVHGRGRPGQTREQTLEFLRVARASAFDQKYAGYTYDQDARKVGERWRYELRGIFKRFHIHDYPKRRILDVGIGNGLEGVGLFDDCERFVGVDIGPESVARAQANLPRATLYCDDAELLSNIHDNSVDIYVSLRTFQSAFFDIREAIRQAYRVLSPGGVIVISIANAYLEGNSFIKGLLPHGSRTVDHDYAHDIVADIRKVFSKMRFDDVGVHSGKAEEYVFARKRL